MDEPRVIQADYVNWRPVNGRRVLQLVFEIDIMHTHDVLTKLGTPTPGESKWCAIALLDLSKPKELVQAEGGIPKKWNEYARSQQAYLLCRDFDFQSYIGLAEGETPEAAAIWVHNHFHIKSRADLDQPENHARWDEFVALWQLHRQRHGRPLRGAKNGS